MPIPSRFVLAVLLVSLSGTFCPSGRHAIAQQPASPVVVATVVEREVASQKSFVANVNPRRRVTIGSAVDGRVLEFVVEAGDPVEAGQKLAQVRTRLIEIELAGAEAELELRRAELTELRNGSRPEEIQLAEAAAAAAEAASEYAQARLARAQRLFRDGSGVSQDEFEAAQAAALEATANLSQTGSSLALARQGPRIEQIEQAAARVAVQEQVVEGLADRRDRHTVRTPFGGFVSSKLTEEGAWVRQGDPVVEVIEIDPVEVEVFVPESIARFVRRGDETEVTVAAIPDRSFLGRVDQLVPLADSRSRTFPVRILVDNPAADAGHPLLPGMLARVMMPTEESQTRLLVPKDALQLGRSQPATLKVEDGKAVVVPIRTGPAEGNWISVEPLEPGALKAGDDVITRGNERLRPGQSVVISERQFADESPPTQ